MSITIEKMNNLNDIHKRHVQTVARGPNAAYLNSNGVGEELALNSFF
jgi:hypothetical protein